MMIARIEASRAIPKVTPLSNQGSKAPDVAPVEAASGTGRKEKDPSGGHPTSFQKLQREKADFNELAKGIRHADREMKRIGGLIDSLKSNLTGIAKQYPPFPRGSEERVKLLKTYNGIRKQIDQMTFPPETEFARQIIAETEESAGKKLEARIGGKILPIGVRRQPLHTGASGLDIPELPEDATDAEIDAALMKLNNAEKRLAEKRGALFVDALSLKESVDAFSGSEIDREAALSEKDAEQRSEALRAALSAESTRNLTSAQIQLVSMMM